MAPEDRDQSDNRFANQLRCRVPFVRRIVLVLVVVLVLERFGVSYLALELSLCTLSGLHPETALSGATFWARVLIGVTQG